MPDREKVIEGQKQVILHLHRMSEVGYDGDVPYYEELRDKAEDALELLKGQEPRLVVKEDFENADKDGYLPVYVEDRNGDMYWTCITDVALGNTVSRFWTTKPTDKQRKAVEWDDT